MPSRAPALRTLPSARQSRSPISRPRVESVISRSVAAFGVVFALQSIPHFLRHSNEVHPLWLVVVATSVFTSIAVAFVLSIVRRRVAVAHSMVATIYFFALVTWPFAVQDAATTAADGYWLYQLISIGTASAAIGFPRWVAAAYLVVVTALYSVIRISMEGAGDRLLQSLLETAHSFIVGAAVITIVSILRSSSRRVDFAQAAALDRYAAAVRQHATEVERVQVDSIIHDSVLTTLLAAARASTDAERDLAATMARESIDHLRDAALVTPEDGSSVKVGALADRVEASARAMPVDFEVRRRPLSTWTIPAPAADAVLAAAVQAMSNSAQHAGDGPTVRRWITIRAAHPGGIDLEIGDTGRGFNLVDVPIDRLGVRVSIIERVANSGGSSEIDSVPGEGTVVCICWPRGERPTRGTEADSTTFSSIVAGAL